LWESLQHADWVMFLATTRWLFGLVLIVHFFSLCFCTGTIVLLDLRVLGIGGRRKVLTALAEQFRPWIWIGFGLAVLSGFLLFAPEAADYAGVTPFRLKMLILLAAVILTFAMQRTFANGDSSAAIPTGAKILAVVSILLWLGAILIGVEIAPLTGLG